MEQKKYTVQEIDALRKAVENKYLWGSYSGPIQNGMMCRPYQEADKARVVEEQVRTFMLGGITADDLRGM